MATVHATQFIVGTVGKIYELRTVGKDNRSVLDFSVAVTPRKRNAEGEWEDGETYWVTVTAWQRLADNVADSWKPGDRVFVYGRTDMKPGYTDKDGVERPARPIVIADFAGHEDSLYPSTQNREASGNSSNGNRSAAPARQAAPAKKAAPAKQAAPAPADDDDLNFNLDDELDGDLPF